MALKPKFPIYESLNFRLTGCDYAILESYQKWFHSIAESLELDVTDSWALPPKHQKIQRFKPNSAIIDADYKLVTYERVIKISDIQSPIYPILLRVAQASLPEGVSLDVAEHTEDQEERRYVPDRDLKELKQQLDEMGGPIVKKK